MVPGSNGRNGAGQRIGRHAPAGRKKINVVTKVITQQSLWAWVPIATLVQAGKPKTRQDNDMSIPNHDGETGIHYGEIHQNSVSPEAVSDMQANGENLTYNAALEDAKLRLKGAIEEAMKDYVGDGCVKSMVEAATDALVDDFGDTYEAQDERYRYEKEGYIVQSCLDYDLIVIKSPFFTWARQCSPCVPNAGDLDNPEDGGLKTYCLGADWFDESNPLPYPIYSVETGELVQATIEDKIIAKPILNS